MELIRNGSFESRNHVGLHYWGLHPDDSTACPRGCTRVLFDKKKAHSGPDCARYGTLDHEECFYIEQVFEPPVRPTGILSLWSRAFWSESVGGTPVGSIIVNIGV